MRPADIVPVMTLPTPEQHAPTQPATQPTGSVATSQLARGRRRWAWIVAAAVAVLAVAASAYAIGRSGSDPTPKAAAATSTPAAPATTGQPAATQVECANIDRAHNAWAGFSLPSTAADVAALNEGTVKMAMDDGRDYLNAVEGYQDQASKSLASAIAAYDFELSLVNVQVTMGSPVDKDQAMKVERAVATVTDKYQTWRAATCS